MSQRLVLNALGKPGPTEPTFVPPDAPTVSATLPDMKTSTSVNQKEATPIGGTIVSYKLNGTVTQMVEVFDDKSLRVLNKDLFNLWHTTKRCKRYPKATNNGEILQKIKPELNSAEVLAMMPRH